MHSRFSAAKIGRINRATQALRLRAAGKTFVQIGAAMGISAVRAWKLIAKEFARLNELRTSEASAALALELGRLDEMLCALWDKALGGDTEAVAKVLAVMQRRAKLLGLDKASGEQAQGQAPSVVQVFEQIVEVRQQDQSPPDKS